MNLRAAILGPIFGCCAILALGVSTFEKCDMQPEDIYPCYCEEDEGFAVVYCNHLTKPEQVKQGLQGLAEHEIWKVHFWRNWILEPLDNDVFKHLKIRGLLFENSTFQMAELRIVGLENSLKSIHISSCFNSTNPMWKLSLGNLQSLREISIFKNKIPVLPNDWLTLKSKLTTLNLDENGLIELKPEVFKNIEGLTFLSLEENHLKSIKRSMFPSPAEDLRTININDNNIESLPEDIFKEMPNLRTLEMKNNNLATIDEDTWKQIMSQLSILDLTGNPIRCDFSLKWMYQIGQARPSKLYGQCETPKRLKGRSLQSLTRRDIT